MDHFGRESFEWILLIADTWKKYFRSRIPPNGSFSSRIERSVEHVFYLFDPKNTDGVFFWKPLFFYKIVATQRATISGFQDRFARENARSTP